MLSIGRSILIGALGIALAGCGGDGSFSSAPVIIEPICTPKEDPAGLWRGTLTSDNRQIPVLGIIAETDETHLVSLDRRTQLIGVATVCKSDFSSAPNRYDRLTTSAKDAELTGTATLEAVLVSRDSIRGTFETTSQGISDRGTVDLFYDSLYERSSDLAKLASVWMQTSADFTLTLTITADGLLTGSDSDGCTYTGDVSLIDPQFNAYALTVQIGSPTAACGLMTGIREGLASLDDTVEEEDTLVVSLGRPTRAISGFLQRM